MNSCVELKERINTIYQERGSSNPIFKDVIYSKLPAEGEKFTSERPFRIIYSGAHGVANDLANVVKAAATPASSAVVTWNTAANSGMLVSSAFTNPTEKPAQARIANISCFIDLSFFILCCSCNV